MPLSHSPDPRLRGLYVITDTTLCKPAGLDASVRAALEGGARIVQYRDKSTDAKRRVNEALALRELCVRHDALFLVNDDVELAAEVRADGVHVGREDANLAEARRRLGSVAVIGASCYDDFELARAAVEQGADYVAFGSVFPSAIKPDAVRASLGLFERAHAELRVATCAIGGITRANIGEVAEAGADMAAVISAAFSADDVRTAVNELVEEFRSR